MPTKHIHENTWKMVENEIVKAVILTKTPLSGTGVLNLLIQKGITAIKNEDYKKLAKK